MSLCTIFFFFNDTATTEIYTLSLHDALPIFPNSKNFVYDVSHQANLTFERQIVSQFPRSEEHTSELQSHSDLVCRLLLEKKKKQDAHMQNDSRNSKRLPSAIDPTSHKEKHRP